MHGVKQAACDGSPNFLQRSPLEQIAAMDDVTFDGYPAPCAHSLAPLPRSSKQLERDFWNHCA